MELDPKSLQGNFINPAELPPNIPRGAENGFSGLPAGVSAMPEDLFKTFPDLHTEQSEVSKIEKQEITKVVNQSFNKESIAEERLIKELESLKHRNTPNSPRDILKDLIMKGELKKVYDIAGHKWTLRALDQGDILLAVDDIKDSTETMSGRMVSIAFSKVVYSIEEIDSIPIYQFFPEILPTQFKSKIEYIIACKKALRAYLIGMPPSVIDEVYEKYTELEIERDKALADLKN
jgi:hypothetical protein